MNAFLLTTSVGTREGNVFRRVCPSVHREGEYILSRSCLGRSCPGDGGLDTSSPGPVQSCPWGVGVRVGLFGFVFMR